MSSYRVTYSDFAGVRVVAGDGPISMSVEAIVALLDEILVEPGSFVSLTDEAGHMLQLLVDDDGALLVDFPSPRERGSYGGRITVDAVKRALRTMDGELRRDAIGELAFERW
ncbi:MAG: hypothetical protein IT373_18910 [Polyangiaceae bacterium]|nr:hypothetical protein [Polyangiaceae bacterium]